MDRHRSGKANPGWTDSRCYPRNRCTRATGIAILGDVFVSALKAIAPLLVFFLVISSLCNAGKSHGGVIKTVIILYMFSTVLAAVIAVFASMAFPVKLTLATAATTDAAAPQVLSRFSTISF